MDNYTVEFFTLAGFQDAQANRFEYFVLILITYFLIISVNLALIILVFVEKSLHEPMYILICNLCANGLYGTVGFYPKFLYDLLSDVHIISYGGCLTQAYIIYTSVMCEITFLTVMSYDRYVAICKPLQYHSILTSITILKLLCFAWGYPLLSSIISVILTVQVPMCGSSIGKLFCDNPSILKQGCFSPIQNQMWSFFLITFQVVQACLILYSYIHIMKICIESSEGRTRFTQTCLPHLLAMIIFLLTSLFDVAYGWYTTRNQSKLSNLSLRNAMALQFLVIPPLFNPIIYGLQLQQIRKAVLRVLNNKRHQFALTLVLLLGTCTQMKKT